MVRHVRQLDRVSRELLGRAWAAGAEPSDAPAPPEAAQVGAQGAGRPPGAQRIGVVDAVAPSQRGGHQRHHLVARVRPPRGIAQVEALPDEFGRPRCRARVMAPRLPEWLDGSRPQLCTLFVC